MNGCFLSFSQMFIQVHGIIHLNLKPFNFLFISLFLSSAQPAKADGWFCCPVTTCPAFHEWEHNMYVHNGQNVFILTRRRFITWREVSTQTHTHTPGSRGRGRCDQTLVRQDTVRKSHTFLSPYLSLTKFLY